MKITKYIKSCGMPVKRDPQDGGTNADSVKNEFYRSYRYENGTFSFNGTVQKRQGFNRKTTAKNEYPVFSVWVFTRCIKRFPYWKNMLMCFAFTAVFAACKPCNSVTGRMEGLANDTVSVILISLDNFGAPPVSIDTLVVKNGRFKYKFPKDEAYDILITFTKSSVPYGPETESMHIFVEPNDKISFKYRTNSTGISNIKISGSKINSDYSVIQNKGYEIFRTQTENRIALNQAITENDKEAETIAQQKIRERYKVRDELYMNYVRTNLQNPVSAFLLAIQPLDSIAFYYDKLGENVRNSIFHRVLGKEMERYTRYINNAGIGNKAPDFTLQDMSGNLFLLSSLFDKEKYVIIDFWGSWCRPCVAGIPKMKNLYETYRDKLEIIGVACDESSIDVWRNTVKRHELTWINLYNDASVQKKYGIIAYPTKIVIDPKGTILIKEEGEGPDFYTKLEALLNDIE